MTHPKTAAHLCSVAWNSQGDSKTPHALQSQRSVAGVCFLGIWGYSLRAACLMIPRLTCVKPKMNKGGLGASHIGCPLSMIITHVSLLPFLPPPLPRPFEFLHYMPQLNSCVSLELSPLCVFVGGGIYPHDPPIPPVSSVCIPYQSRLSSCQKQASWVKSLRRVIASLGHSGFSEESGRLQGHCGGEGVSTESSILGRRSK